jgi:hypothetical protein
MIVPSRNTSIIKKKRQGIVGLPVVVAIGTLVAAYQLFTSTKALTLHHWRMLATTVLEYRPPATKSPYKYQTTAKICSKARVVQWTLRRNVL